MGNLNKYLNSYEFKTTLPISGQELTIKPLTTNGMKKLLVYENEIDPIETEVIIDTLLEEYIVDDINVYDLYVQDRYILFVELRKVSKGADYKFQITCPHCSNQSLKTINLNNLKRQEFDPDKLERKKQLLDGQLEFEMGFFTRAEQFEAHQLIDRNLSNNEKRVEMTLTDLALSIRKITNEKGEEESADISEKIKFVGDLPEGEYEKLKEWMDNNNYCYELNTDIKCVHCGKIIEKYAISLDNFLE